MPSKRLQRGVKLKPKRPIDSKSPLANKKITTYSKKCADCGSTHCLGDCAEGPGGCGHDH